MTDDPISLAARRIAESVRRTPLVEVPAARLPDGVRLLLKLECQQVAGAFKARGAHHFLDRLLAEHAAAGTTLAGVITYSSGNHGRAVAEAAAAREVPALVTVPDGVDRSKAASIERAGAELVRAGPTSESRKARALEIAEERGWAVVPPFDHDWIIEGQGTVTAEILEECPEVTDLWAPVGGGGLAAGAARTLLLRAPSVRLHCVEPEGAAAFGASVAAGERVTLASTTSVADGLLPLAIGERNWQWLREKGAIAETVTDEKVVATLALFHRELEVRAEPSGAVAATPLLNPAPDDPPRAGVHVAIVSGGNVDPRRLAALLEHGREPQ